jgi:molybdenum cofactor cytidylyltransferase
LDWLNQYCKKHIIPLLIEADGSRQKPLKGWAEHEPPIPAFVEQVVHIVGLSGIDKPLSEEAVHRTEIFSKLSDLQIGKSITPDALIRVLTHADGGQKNLPAHARKIVMLNQADNTELQSIAHGMVNPLLASFHAVVISSLKQENIFAVHESVAGIVLAAGESVRFGQPKQLLDWKGQPFVRAVAIKALEAGLAPVIVVVGANSRQVESALVGLKVTIVKNDEWQSGQGSSIKAGISKLTVSPTTTGGAIFLLADQPQITTSIIRALVEKHAEGLYPIVAPMVLDQRSNPVLFDRVTFGDLSEIKGDVGGRAIFHKHRVEYLPWHDDRMLLDVDTPEHYERLINDETL